MSKFFMSTTDSGGFLAGKLQPPPLPAQQVARPRLLDALAAESRPVIVLEAPAGYGKTLLIQQWLKQCEAPYAWLNLDQKDHQVERLAFYLVQAFRQLTGLPDELGSSALQALETAHDPVWDTEDWLVPLLAELNSLLNQDCWLVIDQAHWLLPGPAASLIRCLVDNRPAFMNFVILGQTHSSLPLASWQLQDQLLLLQTQELAFTPQETNQLCEQLHPDFSWREKARLYRKTQGWPAALKLGEELWASWIEKEHLEPWVRLSQPTAEPAWLLPVWPHPGQPESQAASRELTHFSNLDRQDIDAQRVSLHQLTWIHCLLGQPKAARGYNREARERAATQSKDVSWLAWLDLDLAFLEMHKGHLQLAHQRLDACKAARQKPSDAFTALHQLLMASLSWHQGQFDTCQKQITASLLLSGESSPDLFMQSLVFLAAVQTQESKANLAFATLDEAEQLLLTEKLESQGWQAAITLLKTRLWLQEGKQDLALTWLAQLGHQFPARTQVQLDVHLAYCQALLLLRKPVQALQRLETLTPLPCDYPAAPLHLKFKVISALALAANRQKAEALNQLQQALILAEPEQHRLPFLATQSELQPLFDDLREQLAPGSNLLHFVLSLQKAGSNNGARPLPPLASQLSSREQEVLILVAEGLSNQEIGQRLFISLHTVKSHLKHLMKKLGVRSRTQAVTRARELRLL